MSAATALELRRLLEQRFPDALPVTYGTTETVPTGIAHLDAILPSGGLPRGRLTRWQAGGGATALLRGACAHTSAHGERTAWVDGAGVIAGASWPAGPVLLRPTGEREALECAEVLLRSTGFSLVVLAGTRTDSMAHWRLARAAREGGGALVVMEGGWWLTGSSRTRTRSGADTFSAADSRVTEWRVRARKPRNGARVLTPPSGGSAALQVETRIDPDAYRWRAGPSGPALAESVRVRARVRASGLERTASFQLPIDVHEHRLSLDAGLADRRGTPRPRRPS
ncbi:MAG: hypothetical protein ABFS34_00595 [Gemmatimonadota bacterium]